MLSNLSWKDWLGKLPTWVRELSAWKRAALVIIPLVLMIGGVLLKYLPIYGSGAEEEPAMQTTSVRQGDIVLYASGTGTLVPAAEASVGFISGGTVKTLFVQMGDIVEQGQLLAEVDDTTQQIQWMQAKRALQEMTSPVSIAVAEKDVAVALQEEEQAKQNLAYLISPDVLYWEISVAEAETGLAQAEAEAESTSSSDAEQAVEGAEKVLKQRKANLTYAQYVYQKDYVPDNFTVTEFDSDTRSWNTYLRPPTDAEIAEARAAFAEAQLSVVECRYYLDALKGLEIPEDATGSGLTALEQARLDVESARYNLEGTKIYAPISGTVTAVDAIVGETVGSGAVLTIQDLSQPYCLQIYLDESDWSQVQVGFPVEVIFDILSEKTFTGKVSSVDPVLYQSGGMSVVRGMIELDVVSGITLPAGTGATVDVIGGRAENAVLVPMEALHEIGEGEYTVFVLINGKPVLREVEIGLMDTINAEVKSGLQAGDIVTTGIMETK